MKQEELKFPQLKEELKEIYLDIVYWESNDNSFESAFDNLFENTHIFIDLSLELALKMNIGEQWEQVLVDYKPLTALKEEHKLFIKLLESDNTSEVELGLLNMLNVVLTIQEEEFN